MCDILSSGVLFVILFSSGYSLGLLFIWGVLI